MTDARSGFRPVADARPQEPPWPALGWPIETEARLQGGHVELTVADPERDAVALFAALDYDVVWAHVAGRPQNVQEQEAQLVAAAAAGRVLWLMRLISPDAGVLAGTVVGTTSYLDVSPADARLEIGSTALTPSVWGTAVNVESKLLLLSHAFDEIGVGRVQLKTDVRNIRSQRAIAGIGASFEGTLRRYQRRADGTIRDTALFSIIVEEWPAVRDLLHSRVAGRSARRP